MRFLVFVSRRSVLHLCGSVRSKKPQNKSFQRQNVVLQERGNLRKKLEQERDEPQTPLRQGNWVDLSTEHSVGCGKFGCVKTTTCLSVWQNEKVCIFKCLSQVCTFQMFVQFCQLLQMLVTVRVHLSNDCSVTFLCSVASKEIKQT